MTTLYLVRHGQPEAAWSAQYDPGLSDPGRQQAQAAARELAGRGPLPVIVSPLRRTRETAREFEMLWRRWGGHAAMSAVTPVSRVAILRPA